MPRPTNGPSPSKRSTQSGTPDTISVWSRPAPSRIRAPPTMRARSRRKVPGPRVMVAPGSDCTSASSRLGRSPLPSASRRRFDRSMVGGGSVAAPVGGEGVTTSTGYGGGAWAVSVAATPAAIEVACVSAAGAGPPQPARTRGKMRNRRQRALGFIARTLLRCSQKAGGDRRTRVLTAAPVRLLTPRHPAPPGRPDTPGPGRYR